MPNRELIEIIPSKTGSDYLKTALTNALDVLRKDDNNEEDIAFGIENPDSEESIEQYSKIFSEITEEFDDLFANLKKMRSSYLPYEFVSDTINSEGQTESITELSSQESISESYENAFFRMLGLPSTSDLGEFDELFCVNSNGTTERLNKDDYIFNKLDKRQVSIRDRDTSVSVDFYNLIIDNNPIQILVDRGFDESGGRGEELNSTNLVNIMEHLKTLYNIGDPKSDEAGDQALRVSGEVILVEAGEDNIGEAGLAQYYNNYNSFRDFINGFGEGGSESNNNDPSSRFKTALSNIIFLINPGFSVRSSTLNVLFSKYISGNENDRATGLHNSSNFWRFSNLMFPAVQDGRIGKCINEADKLVAEPFLPVTMRKVNGRNMKSSLLEAIIRIRLDIVTGTTKLRVSDFSTPAISFGNDNPNGITYNDIAENYGVLEAYLIARLFNSFSGIAKFSKDKIKEMQIQQVNTGVVPEGEDPDSGGDHVVEEETPEMKALNSIKVIDDSMLLLLGENDSNKAIDFQENVARNSSIIDAHFMEIVTAAVTYPSKWTDKRIEEIRSRGNEAGRGPIDRDRNYLDRVVGRSKGVGIVDIMSFIIAMFSVEEKVLLGLLNERQFGYLKEEFPKDFFKGFDRIEISAAVNELSEAAYDSYELFRSIISEENQQGLFVYSE